MTLSDDDLPEWSKAKVVDYSALNSTSEPWPAAKSAMDQEFGHPQNGGYVAWGPFVVEGIAALDGPVIQSMFLVGNPFVSDTTPTVAFGDDRFHFYAVKGRVMPLPESDGVSWTTTDDVKMIARAIRKGDGPLVGLPESAVVEEIVAAALDGIGDEE